MKPYKHTYMFLYKSLIWVDDWGKMQKFKTGTVGRCENKKTAWKPKRSV